MNKKKQIALRWIIGFIALCLLVWFQGISKTITIYKDTKILEQKAAGYLQFQDRKQNQAMFSFGENKPVQQVLFSLLNKLCSQHKVQLLEMGEPHKYEQSNFELSTYTIRLKGAFKPLLITMHAIELQFSEGLVKGYQFKKVRDRKSKKDYIQLSIWVQSIKALKTPSS